MAYRFLKLVDPLLYEEETKSEENSADQPQSEPSTARSSKTPDENFLIKLYKKPIVSYGVLPGRFLVCHKKWIHKLKIN